MFISIYLIKPKFTKKMKKLFSIPVVLAFISLSAFTIINAPVDTVYKVDTNKSDVKWVGKKVTGQHNGKIKIASGDLTVKGNVVTGGIITIDMTSISNDDITDQEGNAKLLGHLKSADFFNVEKFATAKFEIGSMKPNTKAAGKNNYNVAGKLTIKGITKDVTFPATVVIAGNKLTANADVKLDRTLWDIKYGSGKFFDGLGDKMIHDDFDIKFEIAATK